MKIETFDVNILKRHSAFICAGGFEDRSSAVVENTAKIRNEAIFTDSIIYIYSEQYYNNYPTVNYLYKTLGKLTINTPEKTYIDVNNVFSVRKKIGNKLSELSNNNIKNIYIDISGMSNFLTIMTLAECYRYFGNENIYIIYAEAKEYYPSQDEAKKLAEVMKDPLRLNPNELEKFTSTGTRDFFPLPEFRGNFDEKPIALILFMGYEPIRVAGFLRQYRPTLVIALLGESPHEKFSFRTNYSYDIHKNILDKYKHYIHKVSTFDVQDIYQELQKIYRRFYNEYNIAIFPQNSKLQAVASYLFLREYPDVQLVYCLPGKFDPKHYSDGVGNIYSVKLQ